jgi:phosphocarrier protein
MLFAQAAAAQPVKVRISRPGGSPVDATSVIWVLTLDVRHGDDVILSAEGPAAEQSLDNLAAMLSQNIDRVI